MLMIRVSRRIILYIDLREPVCPVHTHSTEVPRSLHLFTAFWAKTRLYIFPFEETTVCV